MTPCNDLQETPLFNVHFSWFTDGSNLKDEKSQRHVEYAITTPLEVVEAAPLPLVATLAH